MKYLEIYKESMKTGKVPPNQHGIYNGLCHLMSREERDIIEPTSSEDGPTIDEDYDDLDNLIFQDLCTAYWGSGLPASLISEGERLEEEFTPLRQNIVLLLAAINGEME